MKLYRLSLHLTSDSLNSRSPGSAASSPLALHLRRTLRTIYRAAPLPLDRLLRSVVRSCQLLADSGKKSLKVGIFAAAPL